MGKRDYKKGAIPYSFIAIPKAVITSAEWQRLSFRGRALAMDLAGQYTGKNNGRFCPGFDVMSRVGWASKNTLIGAKRDLLECAFALETRKGHPPRTAAWIGFTWWRLDWHESMDVSRTGWPYLNFITASVANGKKVAQKTSNKTISVVQKLNHEPRKTGLRGSESVPIEATK